MMYTMEALIAANGRELLVRAAPAAVAAADVMPDLHGPTLMIETELSTHQQEEVHGLPSF